MYTEEVNTGGTEPTVDDLAAGLYSLINLIIILPIACVMAFMRAATITIVWDWYMPSFGIEPISLAQAFGLSVLVGLLSKQVPGKPKGKYDAKHDFKDTLHRPVYMGTWCTICLGMCWIALQLWGV